MDFELVFDGLQDDTRETLQRVKGVLIADLQLSIPEVQSALSTAPHVLKRSADRDELARVAEALGRAGCRAFLRELGSGGSEATSDAPAESSSELLDFELDLSEILGDPPAQPAKKKTRTKVHTLQIDPNVADQLSFADDEEGEEDSDDISMEPAQLLVPTPSSIPTLPATDPYDLTLGKVDDLEGPGPGVRLTAGPQSSSLDLDEISRALQDSTRPDSSGSGPDLSPPKGSLDNLDQTPFSLELSDEPLTEELYEGPAVAQSDFEPNVTLDLSIGQTVDPDPEPPRVVAPAAAAPPPPAPPARTPTPPSPPGEFSLEGVHEKAEDLSKTIHQPLEEIEEEDDEYQPAAPEARPLSNQGTRRSREDTPPPIISGPKKSPFWQKIPLDFLSYALVGALVLGAGNYLYFRGPHEGGEGKGMEINLDDFNSEPSPGKPIAPTAVPTRPPMSGAPAEFLFEGTAEFPQHSFAIKGRILNGNLLEGDLQATTALPPEPKPEEIVRNVTRKPWVRKVALDTFSTPLTMDGSFHTEAPAPVYLELWKDKRRMLATAKIQGVVDIGRKVLVAKIQIIRGFYILPNGNVYQLEEIAGGNDFRLYLAGTVEAKLTTPE